MSKYILEVWGERFVVVAANLDDLEERVLSLFDTYTTPVYLIGREDVA